MQSLNEKLPEIIVFAGPNGSGKSTITELVKVSDIMHIYDNSNIPFRIFKKRKNEYFFGENENWSKSSITELVNIQDKT